MNDYNLDTGTIGEIVASDFRAASVFKEAGIDFCCGGKKNIDETCSERGIDPVSLKMKLRELGSSPNTSTHNFDEWDLGFLSDYIINTHHKYLKKTLPDLVVYTQKIASVHGKNHPELLKVADLFSQINYELLPHLKNEEEILFPQIKAASGSGNDFDRSLIRSEINRLSVEHESAGGAMDMINSITKNYLVPPDGCNTWIVTYKLLKEFEDDLHVHVHLENNILFPKASK